MIYDYVDTLVIGDDPEEAEIKNTVYRIVYPKDEAPDLIKVLKGVLNDSVSITDMESGIDCGLWCVEAEVHTRPEFGGWQEEFVNRLLRIGYKAVLVEEEYLTAFFGGKVLERRSFRR